MKLSICRKLLQPVLAMLTGTIQTEAVSPLFLSVDVKSVSEVVVVPLTCLEGIWKKATDLLNSPQSISPAPGHPVKARMVMSRGHRPHLV